MSEDTVDRMMKNLKHFRDIGTGNIIAAEPMVAIKIRKPGERSMSERLDEIDKRLDDIDRME